MAQRRNPHQSRSNGTHRSTKTADTVLVTPAAASGRVVTAKRPNHVWHVDLTTVPIGGGFWTPWLPFAWWLAVVIDHYSRRAMGFGVFLKPPTSLAIRAFLGRTTTDVSTAPNHLICDKEASSGAQSSRNGVRKSRFAHGMGPLDSMEASQWLHALSEH